MDEEAVEPMMVWVWRVSEQTGEALGHAWNGPETLSRLFE